MVIELSGEQSGLKSHACLKNWTSSQCEFDLILQVWRQTKIARHEVQLPLYYVFFGIARFSRPNTNSCKSCLPFSCNLISFLKQALKSDWLLWFIKAVSLARKKVRSRAQMGDEGQSIARIASDFKMGITKCESSDKFLLKSDNENS